MFHDSLISKLYCLNPEFLKCSFVLFINGWLHLLGNIAIQFLPVSAKRKEPLLIVPLLMSFFGMISVWFKRWRLAKLRWVYRTERVGLIHIGNRSWFWVLKKMWTCPISEIRVLLHFDYLFLNKKTLHHKVNVALSKSQFQHLEQLQP